MIRATAKVQVLIEVSVGSWGNDCTMAQLDRQAREQAIGRVRNLISNGAGMKVLKVESVEAVVAGEDK